MTQRDGSPVQQPVTRQAILVSPCVHFRIDLARPLRAGGHYPLLLRDLQQLRRRPRLLKDSIVLLHAAALPRAAKRDRWTRELLTRSEVHVLDTCSERLSAGAELVSADATGAVRRLACCPATEDR